MESDDITQKALSDRDFDPKVWLFKKYSIIFKTKKIFYKNFFNSLKNKTLI